MSPEAQDLPAVPDTGAEVVRGEGVGDAHVQALIERAARGDRDSVEALYRLYEADLVSVAHTRLGHTLHDLTESVDLVQSVWTDLLADLDQFEYRGPGSFAAWLRACLVNKIRTKHKYFGAQKREAKRLRHFAADEEPRAHPADPTPSQTVASAEELSRLNAILERFPEPQRRALLLRLRDGLTFGEIASALGRSEEAAKKLFQRGLRNLIPLLPPEWRPS